MSEILLVDDERMIREGLSHILREHGFRVRLASDGSEALKLFCAERPDLVLLDLMMPVMDGFATCREMRRIDRETPIVFLSAFNNDENQIMGLKLGANDYVGKEVSKELLIARVEAALERSDFYSKTEAPLLLTKTEADIYRLLDSHRGKFFSQREILDAICGEGYRVVDAAIRVHVSNLRKKLPKGERVLSKRNLGYALVN